MIITIRAFGIAREICGGASIQLELPNSATAGYLKQQLIEKYPRLGGLSSFLLAVNEAFAESNTTIGPNDEVAVIPPVSGG